MFYYKTFGKIYWIDSENILYIVINPDTYESEIKEYNLRSKKFKTLVRREEILIEDFNSWEKVFVYSWVDEKGKNVVRVYDLKDDSDTAIILESYYSLVVVSKHEFIGFRKVEIAEYEHKYRVDLIKDSKIIYFDESFDITGPFLYLPEKKKLLAYMFINRLIYEKAIGVFQIYFD